MTACSFDVEEDATTVDDDGNGSFSTIVSLEDVKVDVFVWEG